MFQKIPKRKYINKGEIKMKTSNSEIGTRKIGESINKLKR